MEKQEMKETDNEKREKNDNYNPMSISENQPSAQEYHHARHASKVEEY